MGETFIINFLKIELFLKNDSRKIKVGIVDLKFGQYNKF